MNGDKLQSNEIYILFSSLQYQDHDKCLATI